MLRDVSNGTSHKPLRSGSYLRLGCSMTLDNLAAFRQGNHVGQAVRFG